MGSGKEVLRCRGLTHSIAFDEERIVLRNLVSWGPRSVELPVKQVEAVVVQRKSVMPFAAGAILAAIATVVLRLGLVGPQLNQTGFTDSLAEATWALVFLMLIPTLTRAIFVNVLITTQSGVESWRVRYVPAAAGRRLARRFHTVSMVN